MYRITLKTGELVCDNIPSKLLAFRIGRSFGDCYVLKGPGILYDLNKEDREKQNMINMVEEGFSFEIKKLSICTIIRKTGNKYQVHSDHFKKQFSELYSSSDMAVNKFFELKNELGI